MRGAYRGLFSGPVVLILGSGGCWPRGFFGPIPSAAVEGLTEQPEPVSCGRPGQGMTSQV